MHRVKQQLNVTYSSSEEDDDFSSARNVSVAESNESIDKPDESSNDDSPFNNFVRTKSRKQIIYSDDSDEFSFGSRHSTNASGEFSGQHSRIDNRTDGSENVLPENSGDLTSTSTSTKISTNGDSIFIPETDDEEEEKMFQEMHLSPKSRRSITGRRSIAPGRLPIPPNDSDIAYTSDDDNDDFFNISKSMAADDPADLSSVHFDSFGLKKLNGESSGNDDVKRSLTTSSIGSITKTDDSNQMSENLIQSTSTIDESNNQNSRSSFIDLATDDTDDEYLPDIKDASDFGKNTTTSTPSTSKKWIQPTLRKDIKKFVSQQFYETKEQELNAAQNRLKDMLVLYNEVKDKLADNGAKIKKSSEALKLQVQNMEKEFAILLVEEDNIEEVQEQIAATEDWRAGINQIQPKFTGRIGLNTHNTQKALTINRLENLHKALHLCPGDHELAKPPPYLKITLMNHQLHAIKWMRWREKQKPKGGLLADDMGLGKTLTVIALVLDAIYGDDDEDDKKSEYDSDSDSDNSFDDDVDRVRKNKSKKNGGTLIVCPASLVNQWNNEIQTRVTRNKLTILMHHGNNRKTNQNLICKHDIVMTTYGVVSSEHKSNGALYRIHWDRIVLDESHMIRNHNTAMAKAVCELRGNIHWALTGTPIQNKAMDVYSMLKYLKVSPFDDLQTFLKFSDPRSTDGMTRLHNILKPLLLRRTKAELQIKGELSALPTKTINIVEVDLSSDESTVYMHVLTYSQQIFVNYVAQHQAKTCGFMSNVPFVLPDEVKNRLKNIKPMLFKNDVKTSTILVLMLRLRQICNHPGLIKSMLNDDDLGEEEIEENNSVDMNVMKALVGLSIDDSETDTINKSDNAVKLHNILSINNPVYDLHNPSSKCKRVTEMVVRIMKETKDKMIIISQWTSVLNIVGDHLKSKDLKFVELTGKTPIKLRNDIVVSFNQSHKSERIMLLSLVAGGVGLNLTGANHLFLLDPHWNPQLESQAFDRVYRVGQTKDVQIYKLLCNNTIEKVIQDIQTKKLELSENVLTGSKLNSGSKLSFQDMCALFEMGGR